MPSMTQQSQPCHNTADQDEQVLLGVDTHKDVHVAAVITSTGLLLDTRGFPTTREGYRQLLCWARAFGQLQRAGVECTGSYGAALTRCLHHEGVTVTEVNQPDKAARRRHGKSDSIDAAAAARAVLSGRATATAKTTDGPVETVRLFKMAKSSAVKCRSMAINQLKAVLVAAEPTLRESLAGLSNPKLIRRCSQLRPASGTGRRRHPVTRSGSWPGGSCTSPRRSTTSPPGSAPRSMPAHPNSWSSTASVRTRPQPC